MKRIHIAFALFAALCAAALSAAMPPSTHRPPKAGPKMLPRAGELLFGNSAASPLPSGWTIGEYQLTDQVISAPVLGPRGASAEVRLAYPLGPRAGKTLAESMSFRIELARASGRGSIEAARVLAARVEKNDINFFYGAPEMAEREPQIRYLFKRYAFRPLLCALVLCCALMWLPGLHTASRDLLPGNWRVWGALGAIFAGGLLARAAFAPDVPVHINNHGIQEVRAITYPGSTEELQLSYGEVYHGVARLLMMAAGGGERGLYNVNIILGALAALGLFMFARSLGFTEAASLVAAAAAAFCPSQVWVSGTESCMAAFFFFSVTGLALAVAAIRRRDPAALIHATAFLSIAFTLHMITLFFTIIAAIGCIGAGFVRAAREDARFRTAAVICAAVSAAWVLFHAASISPERIGQGPGYFKPLSYITMLGGRENIFLDPTLTPAVLWPAAALGALVLLARRRKLSLYAAAALPVLLLISFTVVICRSNAIRYQSPVQWLYYLPAGYFIAVAVDTIRPRMAAAALFFVFAALFAVNAAWGWQLSLAGDEENNEYRFIREHAQLVGRGAAIRLPASEHACRGRLAREYPEYIAGQKIVRAGWGGGRPPGEVVYIGLDCYSYFDGAEIAKDSVAGGIRRECAAACGPEMMSPLYETTLDASRPKYGYQDRFWRLGSKSPKVGFYRCESK